MNSPQQAIDEAIAQVETARKRVARATSNQITKSDELEYLKAVSYAWFKSHRQIVANSTGTASLAGIDGS